MMNKSNCHVSSHFFTFSAFFEIRQTFQRSGFSAKWFRQSVMHRHAHGTCLNGYALFSSLFLCAMDIAILGNSKSKL